MTAKLGHSCWLCNATGGWQGPLALHVLWLKHEDLPVKRHLHLKCRKIFFRANKGAFRFHVAKMLDQLPMRKTPAWKGRA